MGPTNPGPPPQQGLPTAPAKKGLPAPRKGLPKAPSKKEVLNVVVDPEPVESKGDPALPSPPPKMSESSRSMGFGLSAMSKTLVSESEIAIGDPTLLDNGDVSPRPKKKK